MIKPLLASLILILFQSCSTIAKWQTEYPDNAAEESIENLIERKTGKDIDLTPITGPERQVFDSSKKR